MLQLTCEDWRRARPEVIEEIFRAERDRWVSLLDWDPVGHWANLEAGRFLGTIRGVLITDRSKAVVAWAYYQVERGILQVGGFSAATEASTQLLLDEILTEEMLQSIQGISFFSFASAPELGPALRRRGMTVDRYWYLGRELTRGVPQSLRDARRWRPDDAAATADLLARAYKSPDPARPFAAHGTTAEWAEYVERLVSGQGCGELVPEACVCVPAGPGRLTAVAIATRLSAETVHLAQLAVDPQGRRRGFATMLLDLVLSSGVQLGYRRITLIVGRQNTAARHLYESARFETTASFVAGGMFQPRRSTSVAAGGEAIARR